MEYITILEFNTKERETFIHYVQWTGNEEALTRFYNKMEKRKFTYELRGDSSTFEMDISVKFTEEMVDRHCLLPYGSFMEMFNKYKGTFQEPDEEITYEWLDDNFTHGGIQNFFKTTLDFVTIRKISPIGTYTFHLQWTGNEEALTRFYNKLKNVTYMYRNGTRFEMDITKITKDVEYTMFFNVYSGTFQEPDEEITEEWLNTNFTRDQFENFFH
jgi:hypothetical protein